MAPPNEFPETVDPEAVGSAIEKCTAMQFSRSRYDLQPKKLYRMPCFAPFADGVRDDFYRFNGSLTELQVSLSFALDPLALRIEISSRLLQLAVVPTRPWMETQLA